MLLLLCFPHILMLEGVKYISQETINCYKYQINIMKDILEIIDYLKDVLPYCDIFLPQCCHCFLK